jgi:hypothetical protein
VDCRIHREGAVQDDAEQQTDEFVADRMKPDIRHDSPAETTSSGTDYIHANSLRRMGVIRAGLGAKDWKLIADAAL